MVFELNRFLLYFAFSIICLCRVPKALGPKALGSIAGVNCAVGRVGELNALKRVPQLFSFSSKQIFETFHFQEILFYKQARPFFPPGSSDGLNPLS